VQREDGEGEINGAKKGKKIRKKKKKNKRLKV